MLKNTMGIIEAISVEIINGFMANDVDNQTTYIFC